MTRTERILKLWLRIAGLGPALAIVAVVMPASWMDYCAGLMELGTLPHAPIFEYLARSLSAFYAMMGGLLWLASFDVRRYAGLVTFLAVGGVLFAPMIFIIDLSVGMPSRWAWHEGPIVLAISVVTLVLQALARRGTQP
jgi:hypothetical protein